MSQNFERAQSRLNNIKAIEPLLSALRTISMGNWRVAQRKIADMKEYEKNFSHILMEVLPHIEDTKSPNRSRETIKTSIADTIVLIVGSERGLCGNFNETLAERADQWIKSQNLPSHKVWGLGSRMIQTLEKMNIDLSWRNPLPSGNLVSYQQSYELTQNWLDQYERYNFNRLYVLFNQLEKGGSYHFAAFSLLPYEIQHPTISVVEHERKRWPPPIIETDPKGIYHQIIRYFLASSFYQILLRSAAAEHAARFRLMEEASNNAQEIIDETNQIINTERKRRITQQTQELAVGAGLLDNK